MSETIEAPQKFVPPRMQQRYLDEVRAKLQKEFGYKNPMQVPRLEKIVINMGVGEAAGDQKKLDAAVAELTLIAGQKPVKTLSKKAIAGFKIRAGCRACVTFAGSPARASTAAATSPWA